MISLLNCISLQYCTSWTAASISGFVNLLNVYRRLVWSGSAVNQTCIWSIALKDYVYTGGGDVRYQRQGRVRALVATCEMHQFRHIGSSLLFRSPDDYWCFKIFLLLQVWVSYGYWSGHHGHTYSRCSEADWEGKSLTDGFLIYEFCTGDVYSLGEQSVQTRKPVTRPDGVSTMNNRRPFTVISRVGVPRTKLVSVQQHHVKYRGQRSGNSEAELAKGRRVAWRWCTNRATR